MAARTPLRMVLLLAAAAVVAGCPSPAPSGGTSPTPATSPSASASPAEPSASSALSTQPSPAPVTGPEQVVYFLESDSTGWKPNAGTTILLLFEPAGRAVLYATSPTDKLGHHGKWRYEGGQLTLEFTAVDFKPNATFALDLAATTVTMPFLVSDTAPGTSTWKRGSLSLVTKANIVFHAVAMDPDSTLTPDQAIDEAVVVAQGMVGSPEPTQVLPLAARELPQALAQTVRRVDAFAFSDPIHPNIKSVSRTSGGFRVEYENDAPTLEVQLVEASSPPTNVTKLVAGPLAIDPRVRLDPQPANHSDDPASKRATFIMPHQTARIASVWTKIGLKELEWLGNPSPLSGVFKWEKHEKQLQSHGYQVSTLLDDQATLAAIIQALGGPSSQTPGAPGVVVFVSHGSEDGALATGVDLGPSGDDVTVERNYESEIKQAAAAFPGLVDFQGPDPLFGRTLGKIAVPYGDDELRMDIYLAIRPDFWRWLASRGVRFDKSLVFIDACWTDATSDLREAVSARAYFAWAKSISTNLDVAADYVIDSMIRPTHTSEEAYYNIFRVVTTGQRIYDEDLDLDLAFAKPPPTGWGFLDLFHGYGWNGGVLVPYAMNGWLDGNMKAGNVWWLLFAARWDKTAKGGADALARCENLDWPVQIGETFCTAASPGGRPKTDEVGYATYLLTGELTIPYSRLPVPRMTLRDSEK